MYTKYRRPLLVETPAEYKEYESNTGVKKRIGEIKHKLIHDREYRRVCCVESCIYALAFVIVTLYVVGQAFRINNEEGTRTSYVDLDVVELPGMAFCRGPAVNFENITLSSCAVYTGPIYDSEVFLNTTSEGNLINCVEKVVRDDVSLHVLSLSPFKDCYEIIPNSLQFRSERNALILSFISTVHGRDWNQFQYIIPQLLMVLFPEFDNHGNVPVDTIPTVFSPNGLTFVRVRITLTSDKPGSELKPEYHLSTSFVPPRVNHTLSSQQEGGGAPTTLASVVYMLDSMRVEKIEKVYTYTILDFFGQIGGVLGIIGTALALILGKGSYNPDGLVHSLRILKSSAQRERERMMENDKSGGMEMK